MNERFDVIVTILELIGTAAFAASGALTAIKRRFDLFGVIIIGVTTAVGGGFDIGACVCCLGCKRRPGGQGVEAL